MIRKLTPEDAEAYRTLRHEALQREPFSFGSSPDEDVAQSLDFVRAMLSDSRQALFGVFVPQLVGAVGVRGLPRKKTRHKAEIWGMYLREDHRGRGLAQQLLEAAIQFACSLEGVRFVHLSVSERAVAAGKLYEKLGFVAWATEPSALNVDGVDVSEQHMILRLQP
jgi:RimJ/RimL family protein N-acetyltransferase